MHTGEAFTRERSEEGRGLGKGEVEKTRGGRREALPSELCQKA